MATKAPARSPLRRPSRQRASSATTPACATSPSPMPSAGTAPYNSGASWPTTPMDTTVCDCPAVMAKCRCPPRRDSMGRKDVRVTGLPSPRRGGACLRLRPRRPTSALAYSMREAARCRVRGFRPAGLRGSYGFGRADLRGRPRIHAPGFGREAELAGPRQGASPTSSLRSSPPGRRRRGCCSGAHDRIPRDSE